MSDLERNKSNVIAFFDLMFNKCEPRRAVELYAGAEYLQHNPHVATEKAGFIEYFETMAREYPGPAAGTMRGSTSSASTSTARSSSIGTCCSKCRRQVPMPTACSEI